jgi:GNAT superfamily N-acetyltransferase
MSRDWVHENPPHWDERKQAIVGNAPAGTFSLGSYRPGDTVPGEWWRVEEAGRVVGYGWMDTAWGDAEILLAVDPERRRHGVGAWILDQLEREAAQRGLNYLLNTVPPDHPDRSGVRKWLEGRGFTSSRDGNILRRRVRR